MTQIFYKELSLEEGFAVADLPKHSRVVGGKEVSLASGIELYQALRGSSITCWKCKCVADRWITTLGRNDNKSKPVMNLFATRISPPTKKRPYPISQLVMMTRDHIIPKSYGGIDDVKNLRPGCEICNAQRGNIISKKDRVFMKMNPHLICPIRAAKGEAHREKVKREHETAVLRREMKSEEMVLQHQELLPPQCAYGVVALPRKDELPMMRKSFSPYTFDLGYLHMMI